MSYIPFIRANARFIAFGFLAAAFSSFGQTFFIGLFGAEIRNAFALSHGGFGTIYLLGTVGSAATMVWSGRLIDRFDLRGFTVVVCVGLVAACFVMGAASTVLALGVAIYMLRLTGQGLMSHIAITAMARYFETGRGKAISLASMGHPAGEAVLPVLTVGVIALLGWRATWFAAGILLGLVLIPLVLFLLKGHEERHRRYVESRKSMDASARSGDWTVSEVLRDPRFAMIVPGMMAPSFIVTGFFFHQAQLVESKGWSMTWFATTFVAYAVATVIASFLAGPVVDRLGALRVMPFFLLPMGCALLFLAGVDAPWAALAFMVVAAMTTGAGHPITGAVWAEAYGVTHIGAIRSLHHALMVFSTALSPAAMGLLMDGGVTLESIALLCVAWVLAGSVLMAIAARRFDFSNRESGPDSSSASG
ncbi:MAG TPA: MFS transporter [Arenicellales bacterium]|nr:MFS transporter [Arenicellales bacterium]